MMMNVNHLPILFIFMLILSIRSESLSGDANMTIAKRCIEKERQALLLFKQGLVDLDDRLSSWDKGDCCEWEGVGCDNTTGHVTHLYLSAINYYNFDDEQKKISANISPSLLDLHNLNYLDLSFNYFGLQPIPEFLGSLKNLLHLDLTYGHFGGSIPSQLGNLSKLHYLDLASNHLEAKNIDWLFHLSQLTLLDLSVTSMGTVSNWVSLIQRIPSLSYLGLNRCNLVSTSVPVSSFTNFSTSISNLQLGDNHLNSSIYDWLFNLSGSLVHLMLFSNDLNGRIPESFGKMTAITSLSLEYNKFEGVIPKFFSNLSNLQFIDFSYNNFIGNLDDVLYALPNDTLPDLFISGNQITGSLPDIRRFSSLAKLRADSNELNGHLPDIFVNYSKLVVLDLSHNHLNGSIPDFTGCSSLRVLDLSHNHLNGSIPDFTGCSSFDYLSLEANEFSGRIPSFRGCSSMSFLVLSGNKITEWGALSIGQLSNLIHLDLSHNFLHGTISEKHLSNFSDLGYMDISFNSLEFSLSTKWLPPFQLDTLALKSCKLGPKFPNWIRNQARISIIDFSDTQISDTVPAWFWSMESKLNKLDLSSNNIKGNLSEMLSSLSVARARNLVYLDLSHNLLFGALPDRWFDFQALAFLNLGYNNFSGRIPMSMGHLVSLQTMILRNNNFFGRLPASLRNCSNLGFLDLGFNNLSGKIPAWIGEDLSQLYALILGSNNFYGNMTDHLCHLSDLHFLDLSVNRISGIVPPCFGKLTGMIQSGNKSAEHRYNYTAYQEFLPITTYVDDALPRWKGRVFEYGRNFAYLNMIDLSANELTGEIPVEITRLLSLRGLNLSGNKFYGKVPLEIGRLKMLESLDLSKNKFSGEIPHSISGLNFLGYLDLSNNNFSGRIPTGTQLQGFNVSTYEGNVGLCGPPLRKICPGDEGTNEIQPSSDENKDDEEETDTEYERWLYIIAALGFSSTFWGLCGALVLNRHWRHAYFLFLVNLKDRFFVIIAVCINRLRR